MDGQGEMVAADGGEMAGMGMAGGMEQQEVQAPLVLQCKVCRRIVGDSFTCIDINEARNTMTLEAASNVDVLDKLETSSEEYDLGSTYARLACKCGEQVGRVYKMTPPQLDLLRNMMTFDIACLECYELGKGERIDGEQVADQPSVTSLSTEMTKVQMLILTLNERIQALEEKNEQLEQERAATKKPRK